MAWRLHLSNQAIQHLDILEGSKALLAVWLRRDQVAYFDLGDGTLLGEHVFNIYSAGGLAVDTLAREEFSKSLVAPNGSYLPVVRLSNATLYTTDDGQMRVQHRDDGNLSVESYGEEVLLESAEGEQLITLALDRFLGMIAALDEQGKLHIYQQTILVGVYDLGLRLDDDLRPSIAAAHGAQSIFVTDGQQIVRVDSGGQVQKRFSAHYAVGRLACSPDGNLLATGDVETSVIRIYEGADLTPTHQRFGIDLLTKARQVQLLADLPPSTIALSTMTIDNAGHVAFAMSGVVCVADLEQMDLLPRPQTLF
jgi:hypothetical protein